VRHEVELFPASDGRSISLHVWLPQVEPRALVQIAHGMGEHAARYARLAQRLCAAGYAVYANDHRGHGRTARSTEELGDLGPDGWNRCVRDLRELMDELGRRHPGRPRVLLGHSMGSFLAQQYLVLHAEMLTGAVLSGSSGGRPSFLLRVVGWLARFERRRLGPQGASPLLARLLFGRFNRDFEPARTEFDWLSRDPAEVDLYVADPLCGFVLRVQSLLDMFEGLRFSARGENLARIPKQLPVYVFSGDRDPVHRKLRGVRALLRSYRRAGLERVTHRFYSEGRHEMLNERNREQVEADLLAWLEKTIPSPAS
jgi:alpha-beta hydrolase superfamily lysophospholipase